MHSRSYKRDLTVFQKSFPKVYFLPSFSPLREKLIFGAWIMKLKPTYFTFSYPFAYPKLLPGIFKSVK